MTSGSLGQTGDAADNTKTDAAVTDHHPDSRVPLQF
jgi:hypothetical protein